LDLGYLQKEVAAIIGVDKATIYNWERQRNQPEIRFIALIVGFLGYDPLPVPNSLSEALILYRRRRGLSQERFAEKLKVNPTTLAGWEVGRHSPSRKHMDMLHRRGIL